MISAALFTIAALILAYPFATIILLGAILVLVLASKGDGRRSALYRRK